MFKRLDEPKVGNIFRLLAFIMFAVLFGYSLILTGENSKGFLDEHIYFKRDSVLVNILVLFCAAVFLCFFGKLSAFFQLKSRRNILLAVCLAAAAGICLFWAVSCGAGPIADQAAVVDYAADFNRGDFSGLQKGNYLAMYPQQLGIVTLLRLLFALFGPENYFAFRVFSAAMVCVLLFAGCMIVRELSGDDAQTELYYLLFSMTCFPMYAYSAFAYGDLVSVPFVLLAVWALLSSLNAFRVWKLVGMGLSIGFAVMLRTNVLIVVVAMVIVVLVKFLFHRKLQILAMVAAVLMGVLLYQASIDGLYASKRDREADALPSICHIVMGLNDDNSYPGWYNGYGEVVFEKNQFDAEAAGKEAQAALRSYASLYRRDPLYMLDFFARKMNAQWNAPMYQCIAMNGFLVEEQGALAAEIYSGEGFGALVESYAEIYQMVIYASILFLLISKKNVKEELERYTLLIAVFGGFLFSLMWEAKTRYVFPYLLMMLPYAALGARAAALKADALWHGAKMYKKHGKLHNKP